MNEPAAVGFTGVLTPLQVKQLRDGEAGYDLKPAKTDRIDQRRGVVEWLTNWVDAAWLIMLQINEHCFGFDLDGIETPQYAIYKAGDFFAWHMDQGAGEKHRKLSMTVQLSEPSEYDGGELELRTGADIVTAPSESGSAIAFPSWILHRVTPVTRGVRRALVVWATGAAFR